ncbi:hypothetical protein L6452_31799 [Arctium lappa]|uniref:Uncharacterized protein n=1 Tax=Arctium lappa TaxID=4217 RepID=A0ACB8Z3Y3_ARCLA|nr:hypothetical protein L6452_31799 [Arctium lappa]
MEEINHFSHKKHPLKLINWETVVGVVDDNDEKKDVARCYGCQEPIVGGIAYGCISCSHFMHETCAKLPPTFTHHQDPLHPLTLKDKSYTSYWYCDVCGNEHIIGGLSYRCSLCNFDACLKCVIVAAAQEVVVAALKKEALIKLKHKGHSQHTLTLQLRSATFHCDACNTKDEDLYFVHIKCALNAEHHSTLSDTVGTYAPEENFNEFMLFPMLDSFTDPLKVLHFQKMAQADNDKIEITHWSHNHPLTLNVEPQGNNTPNIVCNDAIKDVARCYGCQEPIVGGIAYGCISCSHFMHETCAKLPPTFTHHQDPLHPLTLKDKSYTSYWYCDVCGNEHIIGGLSYRCSLCNFDACVKCVIVAAAQEVVVAALKKEA